MRSNVCRAAACNGSSLADSAILIAVPQVRPAASIVAMRCPRDRDRSMPPRPADWRLHACGSGRAAGCGSASALKAIADSQMSTQRASALWARSARDSTAGSFVADGDALQQLLQVLDDLRGGTGPTLA